MSRPVRRIIRMDEMNATHNSADDQREIDGIEAGILRKVDLGWEGNTLSLKIDMPRPIAVPENQVQAAANVAAMADILGRVRALVGRRIVVAIEGELPPPIRLPDKEVDQMVAVERRGIEERRANLVRETFRRELEIRNAEQDAREREARRMPGTNSPATTTPSGLIVPATAPESPYPYSASVYVSSRQRVLPVPRSGTPSNFASHVERNRELYGFRGPGDRE